MPSTRWAFTGPATRKATRSMAKEPPNFSTTAPSRSSSNTETATKPSSKPNGILLQQPARPAIERKRRDQAADRREAHPVAGRGLVAGVGDQPGRDQKRRAAKRGREAIGERKARRAHRSRNDLGQ